TADGYFGWFVGKNRILKSNSSSIEYGDDQVIFWFRIREEVFFNKEDGVHGEKIIGAIVGALRCNISSGSVIPN
ncbi:6515_t:CDS:2, partial [Racocetra persica]